MRRVYKLGLLSLLAFLPIQSCDDARDRPAPGSPAYRLVVLDSAGPSLEGGLEMIGSIDALCSNPSGGFFLLDAASMCVRLIGEDGSISTLIRGGEGPGELQAPQSMSVTPWGTLLVADAMKREVMSFSLDGSYEGPFMRSARYVPAPITARSDSTLVGAMQDLQMQEQPVISYRIAVFGDSMTTECELLSRDWIWPDPAVYAEAPLMSYSAGPQGSIFVCGDCTVYRIDIFSDSGVLLGRIDRSDVPRVEKTPGEVEEERASFEAWLRQDAAYAGGYEPHPFRQIVQLAGVDSLQRLWVRRLDVEDGILCDLWSGNGEHLGSASLPWDGSANPVDCVVDAGGVYLTSAQSSDGVRVYRLALIE